MFSQRLLPELALLSVHSPGALNSELCWSAALAAFPALCGVAIARAKINCNSQEEDDDENALFNACPQNTFMERLTVIDFDVFMFYIKGVMITREDAEEGEGEEEDECVAKREVQK